MKKYVLLYQSRDSDIAFCTVEVDKNILFGAVLKAKFQIQSETCAFREVRHNGIDKVIYITISEQPENMNPQPNPVVLYSGTSGIIELGVNALKDIISALENM